MTTCQIRRIYCSALETTRVFSIISTVKLCLVYTILNIYLSMAVASIKREPIYDILQNKENQLSILKLFKVFGTSMQLKLFRIEWNARPNSYRDLLIRGYCVHLTVSKLTINALVKGITCFGIGLWQEPNFNCLTA